LRAAVVTVVVVVVVVVVVLTHWSRVVKFAKSLHK